MAPKERLSNVAGFYDVIGVINVQNFSKLSSSLLTINLNLLLVLQQRLNKSLSFRDGPTGGTSFVNIYQNVRLDP